jgi:hypothetical protein
VGIDLALYTHLDHSGYLPLLVRNGFRGPMYRRDQGSPWHPVARFRKVGRFTVVDGGKE